MNLYTHFSKFKMVNNKKMDGSIYQTPSDLINNAIIKNIVSLDKRSDDHVGLNVIKPDEWKSFLDNIIENSHNDFEIKFAKALLEKFNEFMHNINSIFDMNEEGLSLDDIDDLKDLLNTTETIDEFLSQI